MNRVALPSLMLVFAWGCSGTDTPGPSDGAIDTAVPGDSSLDTGGPGPSPGPGITDGGPGSGPGGWDGAINPASACDDVPTPFTFTPPCPAAVKTCFAACNLNDSTCTDNCYLMIPVMEDRQYCLLCLAGTLDYCTATMGCMNELVQRRCCGEALCGAGATQSCVQTFCNAQANAEATCVMTNAPTCTTSITTGPYEACYGS